MSDPGALQRLAKRILRTIGVGRLQLVDDSGAQQKAQVHINAGGPEGIEEVLDGIPRVGDYGFAYCPPDGSEAIVLFLGGRRSMGAIIATGHRASRPKGLKPGEAMLYNGLTGAFVKMCEDGAIRSHGPWIHDGTLHTTDNISSEKDVTDHTAPAGTGGVSMKKHRDAFNAHNHTDPQGGVVGAANPQAT